MDPLFSTLTSSSPATPDAAVAARLRQYGFSDPVSAWAMIHQLGQAASRLSPSTTLLPDVLNVVIASYDPERALKNIYTLLTQSDDNAAASIFHILEHSPQETEALVSVFAGSQPLSMIIIQDPAFLISLLSDDTWRTLRSREQMTDSLKTMTAQTASFEEMLTCLRTFKKQEYLRIAICDLLKQADTPEVLLRLSDVADLCLQHAFEVCTRVLEERHGRPILSDGRPSKFAIIGMGKLGGQELNFSSDIDLLYVYDSTNGATTDNRLSTYEYYPKLARIITDVISRITPDGLVFRVDLRLRPEGRAGDIANAVDGYQRHYASRGQSWERQALIKARVVAGDRTVGQRFLDTITPFVFHQESDPLILDDINRMREKIAHALIERRSGEHHVKLGPGGIREIEFIIQGFQLIYGGAQSWPWERSTLRTLSWIATHGYLTEGEAANLHDAYIFLRDLENRIQMAAGHQTHEIPADEHEQAVLARMMGIRGESDCETADLLLSCYRTHTGRVRRIYERVFHSAI